MIARLEIYSDADGQYRWRRRAANTQITAQGEAHRFKFAAKRAARKNFPGMPVVDLTTIPRHRRRGVQKLNIFRG